MRKAVQESHRHRFHAGRSTKVKREHGMVDHLPATLGRIEDWPEIKAIIPGPIRNVHAKPPARLKVQYAVHDGFKAQAVSAGCVQEVYFVVTHPGFIPDLMKRVDGLPVRARA